jgi:RNA polymerase-interacting CarD/CdnL/TRCF family regulator
MAKKDLERLIGRAVLNPKFRERLLADPEKTIRDKGFELTEEEMAQIKEIDPESARTLLEQMAAMPRESWK